MVVTTRTCNLCLLIVFYKLSFTEAGVGGRGQCCMLLCYSRADLIICYPFLLQVPKDCLFSRLDFDKDLKGPYDYIVICEHLDLAKISPACSN